MTEKDKLKSYAAEILSSYLFYRIERVDICRRLRMLGIRVRPSNVTRLLDYKRYRWIPLATIRKTKPRNLFPELIVDKKHQYTIERLGRKVPLEKIRTYRKFLEHDELVTPDSISKLKREVKRYQRICNIYEKQLARPTDRDTELYLKIKAFLELIPEEEPKPANNNPDNTQDAPNSAIQEHIARNRKGKSPNG